MKNQISSAKHLFFFCCGALLLSFPTTPIQVQICQHSYHYFLDADPDYDFGTTPPNDFVMAAAIQARMGVPVQVVTTPFFNENTAYPPVLGYSGMPPYYNYGPAIGPVGTGGEIENLNLQKPIVTGIVRGQLRASGLDVLCDGNQYSEFVLRVFTSAGTFNDVLVRWNFCSFQPDNGGVCGSTAVGWDFYQVSGPRPIPGPVVLTGAVSRKTQGNAGTFDLNLPTQGPRGVECRSGGTNGNHKIIFNFSTPLSSVGGAAVTSGTGGVSSAMIGTDPRQYIVNLTAVSNAQYIVVTLTNVNDTAGNHDDSVSVPMGLLTGDTNNDGFVDSADISQVKSQSGNAVSTSNFREDLNTDGFIDSADISFVKAKSGTSLPSPP